MKPLITANYLMCGICLAVGGMHLVIFLKNRQRRVDLFFAVMALCTAASVLLETWAYGSVSVEAFVRAHKAQTVFLGTVWIALVWFTAAYTGFQRRWLAMTITVAYAIAVVMNLVFPYGVLYAKIQALQPILLPWGEQVAMVTGPANPWRLVPDIAWILMIYLAVESCVRLGRKGDRRRAVLFGTSLFVFLGLSYLHGTLMDFGIVGPPSLHHFCLLGLILVMSGSIHYDVAQASILKKKLRAHEYRWRSFFENVKLLVVGTDEKARVNYVNPAFTDVSGFSAAEVLGKPLIDFVPERDRMDLQERFRIAKEGGLGPTVVRAMLAKDPPKSRSSGPVLLCRMGMIT